MGFFLETEKKVPNLRKSKSTTTTEESARRGQVTPVKELDQEQNHSSVKKKKKRKKEISYRESTNRGEEVGSVRDWNTVRLVNMEHTNPLAGKVLKIRG